MSARLPRRPSGLRVDTSLAIVNIVLLLIFFFVVNGQTIAGDRGHALDLPQTADLPLDRLPRPILIVDPGGEWLLDGQPVAPDLLHVAVDALPRPVTLHVLIDRSAPADALVALLRNPALHDIPVRLVTIHLRGGRA